MKQNCSDSYRDKQKKKNNYKLKSGGNYRI
jgi:hypothetical protein